MPIIPPAIVLSTGRSRSKRNLRGEAGSSWLPASSPSDKPWHRFTSNSKRGLAKTRKVNFAYFLVGSKKVHRKASRDCGSFNFARKWCDWVFREFIKGTEKMRKQQMPAERDVHCLFKIKIAFRNFLNYSIRISPRYFSVIIK